MTANVRFYQRAVPSQADSTREGRPVSVNRDYVRIEHPGIVDVVDREATVFDKTAFQSEWQAYLNGHEQIPDGTPVAVLLVNDAAAVEALRAKKVHTVEQLAGLTEEAITNLGRGTRDLVERAKKFLAASVGGAEYHKMGARITELEATNAAQAEQIKELCSRLDKLTREHPEPDVTVRKGR